MAGRGRGLRKARQQRAAELRRARQRTEARRRLVAFAVASLVVVALVVGIVVAAATSGGGGKGGSSSLGPRRAPASVVDAVTGVSPTIVDTVGLGTASAAPLPIPGGTAPAGRPGIVYIGAEYCPFCAGERWALIAALSRFGTFSGLDLVTAGHELEPTISELPTFSFRDVTYASDVLSFEAVEDSDRTRQPLERPTAEQVRLLQKYDTTPYTTQPGSIPFLWIGGRYVSIGASFDVRILKGRTQEEIAAALSDAGSPLTKGIVGAANVLTATICRVTAGAPTAVCRAPGVTAAASSLHR